MHFSITVSNNTFTSAKESKREGRAFQKDTLVMNSTRKKMKTANKIDENIPSIL